MSYQENGDIVTLTMTRGDYALLMTMLGYAFSKEELEDRAFVRTWLNLVNRLNNGNPSYRPYGVSEE